MTTICVIPKVLFKDETLQNFETNFHTFHSSFIYFSCFVAKYSKQFIASEFSSHPIYFRQYLAHTKSQSFTKNAPRWLQNENKTANQATMSNIKLIVAANKIGNMELNVAANKI